MTNDQIPSKTQVLVIGGGPAGSLTASFLVQEGMEVVVCEKEKFPRYHIGESMIPSILPILEFLGIREEIDKYGFVKKYGAHWKLKLDLPYTYTDFRTQSKYKYSYQVIRSEFDELLLNFAQKKGAKVFQETSIEDIIFEGDQPVKAKWVKSDGTEGTISFDYLVDASGLKGIMSNRYLKNRKQQPALANIALCQYWKNFKHYTDENGKEYPGEFVMNSIADGSGWVWAIPLHDNTISIGVVICDIHYGKLLSQGLTEEQIYKDKLDMAYGIKDMLSHATPVGEIRYWNDYSYFAEQFAGDNFRLCGDAAAFLDPLLSTGLHMASISALSAATTICAVIKGDCSKKEAAVFHDAFVRGAYTRYLLIVSVIYQQITHQEEVTLLGTTGKSLQSFFDIIQPILTGNLDMKKNQALPEEKAKILVSYVKNYYGEERDPTCHKTSLFMLMNEHDLKFDSSSAINGYFIRLEKGKLGLEKV